MNKDTQQSALSVSLLALPETTPTCIYGLLEVCAAVGVTWAQLTGERSTVPRLDARIVAATALPFVTNNGVPLAPAQSLADTERTDIAIVTDLDLSPDGDTRGRWADECAWLLAQFERGATIGSVCTGSLCLAEAGLLDNEEATTHWGAVQLFRQYYPRVRLRPERILCHSGPGRRIVTGGGSGAWTDLALHLIAQFCGTAEAVRISKIFVLGDHSDGQLPFAAMNRRRYHEDAVIGRCQNWVAEHYALSNPVARLVEYSRLPARTFKRRFKSATGYTPVDYVQTLRIEEARQWLEASNESVDAIAHRVGYEDPAYFRRLFKRKVGTTPARYRQRFAIPGGPAIGTVGRSEST